jgi:hypothetical protein
LKKLHDLSTNHSIINPNNQQAYIYKQQIECITSEGSSSE